MGENLLATASALNSSVSSAIFCVSMTSPATAGRVVPTVVARHVEFPCRLAQCAVALSYDPLASIVRDACSLPAISRHSKDPGSISNGRRCRSVPFSGFTCYELGNHVAHTSGRDRAVRASAIRRLRALARNAGSLQEPGLRRRGAYAIAKMAPHKSAVHGNQALGAATTETCHVPLDVRGTARTC